LNFRAIAQPLPLAPLVNEGVIDSEDRELFWFAEAAQEIWSGILQWYDVCGEPLCIGT